MGLPRWAEVILVLLGALVVLGLVAGLVSELVMKRWRARVKRRRRSM
ncbi:MAG: hypothetical protein QOK15_3948 [Nocardioidaceae bacterium]|jgi:uncharacterized integral membrane protein|nr:hypothetical protein [Nocardioidaceae bacterium]